MLLSIAMSDGPCYFALMGVLVLAVIVLGAGVQDIYRILVRIEKTIERLEKKN
jgi:hypothetical protein